MARLDHIAMRVQDRHQTSKFFQDAFGYRVQKMENGDEEFTIDFGDGQFAKCIALEPSEKKADNLPWVWPMFLGSALGDQYYHMAPELFVSDGSPDSIVGKWVKEHNGVGGIHHLAFQCDNVAETMKEWKEKGWLQFTTDEPITCPGLTQVFSKPSAVLGGVVIEFITREKYGFCEKNVKALMMSTEEKGTF